MTVPSGLTVSLFGKFCQKCRIATVRPRDPSFTSAASLGFHPEVYYLFEFTDGSQLERRFDGEFCFSLSERSIGCRCDDSRCPDLVLGRPAYDMLSGSCE